MSAPTTFCRAALAPVVAWVSLSCSLTDTSELGARYGLDAALDTARDTISDVPSDSKSDSPESGVLSYSAQVLSDKPLAYYRMEETAATTAKDSSGNGHDGLYFGSVTVGVTDTPVAGNAARFAGGRIEATDIADFALTKPFTLELWVRPTTAPTVYPAMLSKFSFDQGWKLAIGPAVELKFYRYDKSGGYEVVNANASVGKWFHFVALFDGVEMRLYVNGVAKISKASPQLLADTTDKLEIGGDPLRADLDEVALYDRVLSGDRILAHFNARKP